MSRNWDLFDLTGKRACITGASSGIGQALASGLAVAGASVVGVARRSDALETWQEKSRDRGLKVDILAADLGSPASAADVAQQVGALFGMPDILINAAGVNARRPADEITVDEWRRVLDLNLSTPFFLAQAFVPAMQAKAWGRIINIASLQSQRAFTNGISYGASKGGVTQLTRAMAEAWSRDGILCNAIAPGFFPTPLTGPVYEDPAAVARLAAQTCVGRNGELADLVGPAVFFASEASRYVTGQVLYVDGGFTAK
ncbi:MAG: SDR family oxidoreductase [Pseudomonadota bacterium]